MDNGTIPSERVNGWDNCALGFAQSPRRLWIMIGAYRELWYLRWSRGEEALLVG